MRIYALIRLSIRHAGDEMDQTGRAPGTSGLAAFATPWSATDERLAYGFHTIRANAR
jgi:hypothetical protein